MQAKHRKKGAQRPVRPPHGGQTHKVRIIAGRWRGRRLPVADVPGLRPTPDRTRETLFNWLAPFIPGARCLDLFAGSGALGFEALSRGAQQVTMIERDARVFRQLQEVADMLQAEGLDLHRGDALTFLKADPRPFDVLFLDPPFRQGLLAPCLQRLDTDGWLAPGARIYLEVERELGRPDTPEDWQLLRDGQAGQVAFFLLQKP
jgi:16S rRNA (guanine966-N2)-methyltransferase